MSSNSAKAGNKGGGNIIAIITMFFLFAMIAFVTNLAAPIGTIWKAKYAWAGMVGNMMNFLAYLFMGIPAGKLLSKIGYKATASRAIIVGIIGLALQLVASYMPTEAGEAISANYYVYLLGAFICGFCVCMLNAVVNPMLNNLGGGGNRGNQLIQIGGSCNSLAATMTPLFVGILVGQVTQATTLASVASLLYIAIAVFVLSFIVIRAVNIPESNLSSSKKSYAHSPWHFRHFVLGVIAIFFYIGVEVGVPGILNLYLSGSDTPLDPTTASAVSGAVVATYWLLMLVGRLVSSAISDKVSSKVQMIAVSVMGIIFVGIAMIVPIENTMSMPSYSGGGFAMQQVPVSACLLVLVGLCTSVMWGGIFNLAVEGLGKYTEQASGIFMMMVVGGGIMPLIQEQMAGVMGYIPSYILVVGMLAYMLYYALIGSKNVNTDIPVGEEPISDPV